MQAGIVRRREDNTAFLRFWNEFLSSNRASFHYEINFIDYMLLYASTVSTDESFVLMESGKPVGICFLPIEDNLFGKTISLCGDFIFGPLSLPGKYEKKLYEAIDSICVSLNVKKVQFMQDSLIFPHETHNPYLQHGFMGSSFTDTIVDLRKSEADLWSNLRKGHKYDINLYRKNADFSTRIFDYTNPSYEVNELYRKMHAKCAGRETRSKETFDKQFEMLTSDQASILVSSFNGELVAFNYFMHSQNTVQYASAADDPCLPSSPPVYHALLWEGILYYKERGFDLMRLAEPCGLNEIDGFMDLSSPKQIAIGRYKRGFGGDLRFVNRGIKYYDLSLLVDDIEAFKRSVLSIQNNESLGKSKVKRR